MGMTTFATPSPPVLDLLFNAANLFVLPFWALMVIVPKWSVSQKILSSPWPFAALAGLYLYLFVTVDSGTAAAFSDPQLSLATLAGLFAQPHVMATGWVHFLVMDLFVGRWIYFQGLEQDVFTRHSLVLCLFAGPLGLLVHLTTQGIVQWRRQGILVQDSQG